MDSSFAQRLNYAMEQAGMNQAALAERTGASKAAISQYLHGKNIPGLDRMKALADATGVSFTYLMGNSAEVKKEIAIRKISIRRRLGAWENRNSLSKWDCSVDCFPLGQQFPEPANGGIILSCLLSFGST